MNNNLVDIKNKAQYILKHAAEKKKTYEPSQCKIEQFASDIHQASSYLSYTCAERNKNNSDRCVCAEFHVFTHKLPQICLLNIGSIRIYILTTGVVSNETNTYVRMYIEEFILVDIWIHCCTKLKS